MKKHHMGILIEKNAFVDQGDGLVQFPSKMPITDGSQQLNGTRYDIESMDLSKYKGQLTADHVDSLNSLIGKVQGVAKVGTQVVIDSIQFAVRENALARLAYNLLVGGYLTDFSIETIGPMPDDQGVYHEAELIGLSAVVVGNNLNAHVNQIVTNSIKESEKDGLDTTEIENNFLKEFKVSQNHSEPEPEAPAEDEKKVTNNKDNDMKFVTIKNTRDFAVKVSYKNAAGDDVETTVEPDGTVDVEEGQVDAIENQLKAAKAPEAEKVVVPAPVVDADAIANAIKAAITPMQEKLDAIEQNSFDKKVVEPEFKRETNGTGETRKHNEFASMDWQERGGKQINAAWDLLKRGDSNAQGILNKINEVNLDALKKANKVSNSLTISDFGNFVISPELLTQIEGCRNDYTPLVNATSWQDTLSTQMAWLKRSGDISMESVEFCDDGVNGNLKPISEYGATIETSNLEELAAVTPVCNAATRFLAADLLGDVAAGYRNDYDRKRAQLVIARLEQAVEANGNSVIYDTNPSVDALVSLLNAYKEIANCTPNGTFIMNTSSHVSIMAYALRAGISGPLSQIFTTGSVPLMFGRPYIVVSDDLLPSLDSTGTVTIVVDGVNVVVNHAVFYANLSNFTGRTSGGLQYDLSTDAAYEDGQTVKSAFQRNELVLRGSFFRGGAIKDTDQVAGVLAPGVS